MEYIYIYVETSPLLYRGLVVPWAYGKALAMSNRLLMTVVFFWVRALYISSPFFPYSILFYSIYV
jgi:hypothetical protein